MPRQKYDIITMGSGTWDVFANTEATYIKKKGNYKELISYPTGSKILIHHLKYEIGGGGTNTAASFRKLGMKTAWLGKVGSDETSRQILLYLKNSDIGFLGAKGEGHSGYSVILDSKGHDRTILTHKGENDKLSFQDINLSRLNTGWFYFSSMMGKSFLAQKKLAAYAKKKDIRIAFNPSSYQVKEGSKKLSSILKNTEVLIFNLEEARLLVGIKDQRKSIGYLMARISDLGPKIVVVTDGNKGAYCYDGKLLYFLKAHPIKIIETTGAGDAFASAFVSGLIRKQDIPYALKLGQANAESIIRHYGAKNKLLPLKEAEKRAKVPTKITIKDL